MFEFLNIVKKGRGSRSAGDGLTLFTPADETTIRLRQSSRSSADQVPKNNKVIVLKDRQLVFVIH
jgi:hypothetical protein